MHSDLIADLLTRIRNASRAGLFEVNAHFSGICLSISEILAEEGYVKSVKKTKDDKKFDQITIKLDSTKRDIEIKRISKPGQRIYVNSEKIPHVLNGLGIAILSTSKGIMTGKKAQEQGVGGEVLCEIW